MRNTMSRLITAYAAHLQRIKVAHDSIVCPSVGPKRGGPQKTFVAQASVLELRDGD
jgi:hypothetical protein